MFRNCRECHTKLDEDEQAIGLCADDLILAPDYARYDALCEEGHSAHAAKLMAGLADPPAPDND